MDPPWCSMFHPTRPRNKRHGKNSKTAIQSFLEWSSNGSLSSSYPKYMHGFSWWKPLLGSKKSKETVIGFHFHRILISMTKLVAVSRKAAKKVIKKSKDQTPFLDVPATIRDPRQQRMTNILSGLRHLKAPVVADLHVGMLVGSQLPILPHVVFKVKS